MRATDQKNIGLPSWFSTELSCFVNKKAEIAGKLNQSSLREATMIASKFAEILLRVENHEHVNPEEDDVLGFLARRRLYLGLSPDPIFHFSIVFEEIARRRVVLLGRAEYVSKSMRQSSRAGL